MIKIRKFKTRLLLRFFFFTLVISTALYIYTYHSSKKLIYSETINNSLDITQNICNNIEIIQSDLKSIYTYISIDSALNELLSVSSSEHLSITDQVNNNHSLEFILNLIASKPYISGVIIYSSNNMPLYSLFTDMSSGIMALEQFKQTTIEHNIVLKKGAPYYFQISKNNVSLIENNKANKIALGGLLKDVNDYSSQGFLILTVNEDYFINLCEEYIKTQVGQISLLDDNNNVLFTCGEKVIKDSSQLTNLAVQITSKNTNHIFAHNTLTTMTPTHHTNWKILYSTPTTVLEAKIAHQKAYIFIIILGCALLTIPISYFISSSMTAPLKRLLNSMHRFEQGYFNEKVPIDSYDEIGELSVGYNKMVANIKELIDKVYIGEIRLKESEMKTLQSQINPHFLYNTLDSIFWKSQKNGDSDVAEMIYALSKLFRLTLNNGNQYILIKDEEVFISNYLKLYQLRYPEKIQYIINISKSMYDFYIPKLIIQPFVENAIIHGLYPKENGGLITLNGYLENSIICFKICDNGIGFINDELHHEHFAIKNIKERLELLYEDHYTLKILSEPNQGTTISLKIPLIKEDDDNESNDYCG